METDDKSCVICGTSISTPTTTPTSTPLDLNLSVIFFLKELFHPELLVQLQEDDPDLDVRRTGRDKVLEEWLIKKGEPSTWLCFCEACHPLVQETKTVWARMVEYQRQFQALRQKILDEIQSTLTSTKPCEDGFNGRVRAEIVKFHTFGGKECQQQHQSREEEREDDHDDLFADPDIKLEPEDYEDELLGCINPMVPDDEEPLEEEGDPLLLLPSPPIKLERSTKPPKKKKKPNPKPPKKRTKPKSKPISISILTPVVILTEEGKGGGGGTDVKKEEKVKALVKKEEPDFEGTGPSGIQTRISLGKIERPNYALMDEGEEEEEGGGEMITGSDNEEDEDFQDSDVSFSGTGSDTGNSSDSDSNSEESEQEMDLDPTQTQSTNPRKRRRRIRANRIPCSEPECVRTFPSEEKRALHFHLNHEPGWEERVRLRKHGKTPKWTCTQDNCTEAFYRKKNLKQHLAKDHGIIPPKRKGGTYPPVKRHLCSTCGIRIRNRNELAVHIRKMHTGERPFPCGQDHCTEAFITPLKREHHIERFHTHVPPIKCTFGSCTRGFFRQHRLQTHLLSHTKAKDHICEVCGAAFSQPTFLKYHQTQHAELNKDFGKFTCDQCGKIFGNPTTLRNHVKAVHLREYRFHCEVPGCDQGFLELSHKRRHMLKKHTDEKEHACDHCEKRFRYLDTLRIHIRTHTKEKPFPCRSCDSAFICASKLRRHELIHEKKLGIVEPRRALIYVCEYCGKGCAEPQHLTSHKRFCKSKPKAENVA